MFNVHLYDPSNKSEALHSVCLYMSFVIKPLLCPVASFLMKKQSHPPAAWPLLNLWRPVMTVPTNLHRLYHTGSYCRKTVTPMAAENGNTQLEMNLKQNTLNKIINATLCFCPYFSWAELKDLRLFSMYTKEKRTLLTVLVRSAH